jgi:hypothetical protein
LKGRCIAEAHRESRMYIWKIHSSGKDGYNT